MFRQSASMLPGALDSVLQCRLGAPCLWATGSSALGHATGGHFSTAAPPTPTASDAPAAGAGYRIKNAPLDKLTHMTREFMEHGFGMSGHPGLKKERHLKESFMSQPIYTQEYVESIKPISIKPEKMYQKTGSLAVTGMRSLFDFLTGYGPHMTEAKWLHRMIFLESVAGVPGMVGGMVRHLRSLRTMKEDNGWIHTLLEEAENERMHLLTFMHIRNPGLLLRASVLLTQGIFFNLFFVAYLLSPRHCHAFVGYLEEEAIKTYSHALADIDAGKLWKGTPAPEIAVDYWKLAPGASMRDVILAVRADEACHCSVNHTFSVLKEDEYNPFAEQPEELVAIPSKQQQGVGN